MTPSIARRSAARRRDPSRTSSLAKRHPAGRDDGSTPRADLLRCHVSLVRAGDSKLTKLFFRSPHTSSRPMFTRVSWIHRLPESARICSKKGKQYQIAVSDLPFPLPNPATAHPACKPPGSFPRSRSRVGHGTCEQPRPSPMPNTRTLTP